MIQLKAATPLKVPIHWPTFQSRGFRGRLFYMTVAVYSYIMICAAQQPVQITEELPHGREVGLFYLLTKSRLANKYRG